LMCSAVGYESIQGLYNPGNSLKDEKRRKTFNKTTVRRP
jgi:hypothetical protein